MRSAMRSCTSAPRMRCAVEGCRLLACASAFSPTGSGWRASTSSSFIMRSITWIELFVSGWVMVGYRIAQFYTTIRNTSGKAGNPACYDSTPPETLPRSFMRVGLFVTCLVDLMRPSIGFAAVRLLESAGHEVVVPRTQTCCGQPGWNSGDRKSARALAEKLITEFEDCDYVVAPSGSCTGMIRTHFLE